MTEGVEELTLEVTAQAGRLAGAAEAASVLESMGIGDERAKTMGRANVFRLAAEVVEEQDRSPAALAGRARVEARLRSDRVAGHRAPGRAALRGAAIAVPVVASFAASTVLTASLWNDGPAGIERATAIGLAAATSLPVAAGFVLAMGAPGARGPGVHGTLRPALAGIVAAVVSGLALWAALSAKDLIAPSEVGVALGYFAMLSALWLAGGLAVAAGREWWVTIAFAGGTAVAVVLRLLVETSLATAQSAGILAAAAVALAVAVRTARGIRTLPRSRTNGSRTGRAGGPAPARVSVRAAVPVVLFGTAFAALVFVSQIATWYSQSPPHDWILSLRPDTQAGWTWALVAVLGAVAVVAASAQGFAGSVAAVADRTPLTAPGRMTPEIAAVRRRAIGWAILAAVAGAAASFVVVVAWMAASTSMADTVGRDTAFVFAIVGPGLILAALAAFDCAVLVTFRRPRAAVVGAVAGLAVAAAASVVLAKVAAGWTVAAGFDAGVVVCWALVGAGARRVLRAPDVALAGRG
ncbi:MAG TPA: hypothetical protein VNN79_10370 [Actinomycetota bacterium]|nr:hypothetical protein [Actinomycetota bacterium]